MCKYIFFNFLSYRQYSNQQQRKMKYKKFIIKLDLKTIVIFMRYFDLIITILNTIGFRCIVIFIVFLYVYMIIKTYALHGKIVFTSYFYCLFRLSTFLNSLKNIV